MQPSLLVLLCLNGLCLNIASTLNSCIRINAVSKQFSHFFRVFCFQHQRGASGPIELQQIGVNSWNFDEVCSTASKDRLQGKL